MVTENAYFAGGCFWGVEHGFQMIPGVISVESGYQQGSVDNPTYKQVCTGNTGHAESVKIVFDPAKVSYEKLVRFFMALHDPTQLNRQGPDFGTQYRSGIYTVGDEQLATARKVIAELAATAVFNGRTIVTEVEPAKTFYAAEDYHQDYIEKTGRACHVNIHGSFKAAGRPERPRPTDRSPRDSATDADTATPRNKTPPRRRTSGRCAFQETSILAVAISRVGDGFR